jgi:hypothetical protein
LRLGGCGDPDFGGTSAEQNAGAGAGGGTGGEDVVDEEDFAAGEGGGAGGVDLKGSAKVAAALGGVEAVQGAGILDAKEEVGAQGKVPGGGGALEGAEDGGREELCLVEATLPLAGGEERDGDDEEVVRRHGLELQDGCGEAGGEQVRGDTVLAAELEQVEELAHLAVVVAGGDGAGEGGWSEAAGGAFGDAEGGGEAGRLHAEVVAAASASGGIGRGGGDGGDAGGADADGARLQEWSATETAFSREKDGGEISGVTSEHALDRTPSCCACVPARRSAVAEMGHLHACAEDRTSLAEEQEKHQLCRWM